MEKDWQDLAQQYSLIDRENRALYSLPSDPRDFLLPDLHTVRIQNKRGNSRALLTLFLSQFNPKDPQKIPYLSLQALATLFYGGDIGIDGFDMRMAKQRVQGMTYEVNKALSDATHWRVQRITPSQLETMPNAAEIAEKMDTDTFYGLFYLGDIQEEKVPISLPKPAQSRVFTIEDGDELMYMGDFPEPEKPPIDDLDQLKEDHQQLFERLEGKPHDISGQQIAYILLALKEGLSKDAFEPFLPVFYTLGSDKVSPRQLTALFSQSTSLQEFLFACTQRIACKVTTSYMATLPKVSLEALFRDTLQGLQGWIQHASYTNEVHKEYQRWNLDYSLTTYLHKRYAKTPAVLQEHVSAMYQYIEAYGRKYGAYPTQQQLFAALTQNGMRPAHFNEAFPFALPYGTLPKENLLKKLHGREEQRAKAWEVLRYFRNEKGLSLADIALEVFPHIPLDESLRILELFEQGKLHKSISKDEVPSIVAKYLKTIDVTYEELTNAQRVFHSMQGVKQGAA